MIDQNKTNTTTTRTLTPEQAAVIKATVPVLAEHGLTITRKFYANMLAANPSLKSIFNNTHQTTSHQPMALAGALYAYAANITNLGALSPALELICHKHVSLYIHAEHYDVVGTHLLATMKAVLGDAATPEIMDAWGAAYWQLADIMIAREGALYEETKYWPDWADFKIVKKVKESSEITSFYLEPVDEVLKSRLPVFKPGQYISVNLFVQELEGGVWQARQYSLSEAPGKGYLRISVKRELGVKLGEGGDLTHPGYLSNLLHDTKEEGDKVRVSHPFGDFFFEEQEEHEQAPVVLVAAGVGSTALKSIFGHLMDKDTKRPVSWIQGARNAKARPFKSSVDEVAKNKDNVRTVYFASSPGEEEVQGEHYDIVGRVDLGKVGKDILFVENEQTEYFICGPTQFMLDTEAKLKSYGVPNERIKLELFGTGGVPRV